MSYGGMSVPGRHDLTHSPVGLWQLDGNLLDSSGNGFHLTMESGTERYSDVLPGLSGFYADTSSNPYYDVADTALNMTGAVTIEFMAVIVDVNTSRSFVNFGAFGATEVTNVLYNFGMSAANPNPMVTSWESGVAVAVTHVINAGFPVATPFHAASTRSSGGIVRMYLNGKQVGDDSSALTMPTGGSSSRFRILHNASSRTKATIASVKVLDQELTPAQILAEYNKTLGVALGKR